MNKVYFSTVVRGAPLADGGRVVRLDWESKQVEASAPIVPARIDHDPNPRGNARGGRGIVIHDGRVIVASYHDLHFFDLELEPDRQTSHDLMVGLHETCLSDSGRILVTSTAIDAVLEYDLASGVAGRSYWPREMEGIQKALGVTPKPIDKTADNRLLHLDGGAGDGGHLHLNACAVREGEVYALFHSSGVVANLDRGEVVLRDAALVRPHNLTITADGTVILNDSFGGAVRAYDLDAGTPRWAVDLRSFGWVRSLIRGPQFRYSVGRALSRATGRGSPPARPLFVRGLDLVEDHLFVGISPASILQIDWKTGELVDAYCHSRDVRTTVHGLAVI